MKKHHRITFNSNSFVLTLPVLYIRLVFANKIKTQHHCDSIRYVAN